MKATSVYDKKKYGDKTTAIQLVNSEKTVKNGENHIKLPKKSQNQLKNQVILYYISVSTCQITHIRTVAVQPPILCKKFSLYYINGGTQERKFNFVKSFLDSLINGCTQEKNLTYLFFLHHINAWKRVKIIPHFHKNFHNNFTDFSTELSFFVKISQNYRFLWKILLADEW